MRFGALFPVCYWKIRCFILMMYVELTLGIDNKLKKYDHLVLIVLIS